MPKNRIVREGKLRGPGHVYVSVRLNPDIKDHTQWVNRFYDRLVLITAQSRDLFMGVMRTNEGDAGDVQKERDPQRPQNAITDVVGVLTDTYLLSNIDSGDAVSTGELASFFERLAASETTDEEIKMQIFLAPVDPPNWKIKVRKIALSDPRLVRLRDSRFTWPSESLGKVADEIAAAVDLIVYGLEEQSEE
jgi:hypothetical protein